MNVHAHLTDGAISVVVLGDAAGGAPWIGHWGSALGSLDESDLALALERPVPGGGLDVDPPPGLVAEAGQAWFGSPGIVGRRAKGTDFAPRFKVDGLIADEREATWQLSDEQAGLSLELRLVLTASGVVTIDSKLSNAGCEPYWLDGLQVTVPVPGQALELLTVGGRWTNEFRQTRSPWIDNCMTIENRRGKTSHERAGMAFAGTPGFREQSGEVWGCHVGWSGNFRIVCDAVSDARRSFQVGELLGSGEIALQSGQSYTMPTVYLSYGATGLNEVSQRFHAYVRGRVGHPRTPRKVLLNTWEAIYFDHRLDRLTALADRAAAVGVERFVVDDGWFHLRRNETAGLGDWWVDSTVWPDGLNPLIEQVRGLGMEFGIWVEPEMVNPDSDLYRAHPEWTIDDPRYPALLGRNQLVLDLGRAEVREHLYGHLDALLCDYDISYVKWDMNRDLIAATGADGRPGVHAQTLGVYELFDRLRAAHPTVEFESCASGGGRIDLGILARTDRVWTSDSIDALDRQSIQRGYSLVFPPELMGSHIGAPTAHTTGRTHTLGLRAASALFGHLGIEWNLLTADETVMAQVTEIVSTHKRFRGLLHSGRVVRVDHPDPNMNVHGVVASDGGEALFSAVRTGVGPSLHSSALRFPGLDPGRIYDVHILAFGGQQWGPHRSLQAWLDLGLALTGRQLAVVGLHAPVLNPETALLLHLSRR